MESLKKFFCCPPKPLPQPPHPPCGSQCPGVRAGVGRALGELGGSDMALVCVCVCVGGRGVVGARGRPPALRGQDQWGRKVRLRLKVAPGWVGPGAGGGGEGGGGGGSRGRASEAGRAWGAPCTNPPGAPAPPGCVHVCICVCACARASARGAEGWRGARPGSGGRAGWRMWGAGAAPRPRRRPRPRPRQEAGRLAAREVPAEPRRGRAAQGS